MPLVVESYAGARVESLLDSLAALRIEVFREWPYLYDGSLEYERRYLRSYLVDEALLVVVRDGNSVVGVSTALPLSAHEDASSPVLSRAGIDLRSVYYFGESVLLPGYRGQGIGHRFFDEREAHALKLGYSIAAFAAVERPLSHPLCPGDYVPHDAFWEKRGFARRGDLVTTFRWKDLGDSEETTKPMVFWLKRLNAA